MASSGSKQEDVVVKTCCSCNQIIEEGVESFQMFAGCHRCKPCHNLRARLDRIIRSSDDDCGFGWVSIPDSAKKEFMAKHKHIW